VGKHSTGCPDCLDDNTLCGSCAEQIRDVLASGQLRVRGFEEPSDPVVAKMQERYVGVARVPR